MSLGAALVDLLGELFAPAICWSCSGAVRRGDPLCASCRLALHRLAAEPVLLSGVSVWAPLAYSGPARDLVRALKFRGAVALADAMAAQIVANAPLGLVHGRTIVPVPLHPRRERSRGYNQAALIGAAVAERAGVEVCDCLRREGSPVAQVGRNRAERTAGPAGRVAIRASAQASAGGLPESVLLVDDVVTTGATLRACRDAVVAHGARDVAAVCFARTIGR